MTGTFNIAYFYSFVVADNERYALGGAPYKINVFLEGAHNFRGPESEGFVASVYNFSGSLDESNCGNCERQSKDGVKCIAQVPATAPMRHRLEEIQKDPEKKVLQKRDVKKFLKENAPKPLYVALNGLGIVSLSIVSLLHLRILSDSILYSRWRWVRRSRFSFTDLRENFTSTPWSLMSVIPCNMSL